MFKKILIANRGEIAVRIIRACHELGIDTVAVYSDADKESLHVRLADESVCIGPGPAVESYLNIPNIISAATITGADAIHPGYGFLSENAYFAEVCESSGIKFIGPSKETIQKMGNKIEARTLMQKSGIPIVPGTVEPISVDSPELLKIARRVGYPVIIKAAAGGGGRGMRIVQSEENLKNAISTAQTEAKSAFGDDQVFLEKLIFKPRHIEFQVAVDAKGHGVFFPERDCSIQRRHQKLVEESPAPGMNKYLRHRMGKIAVKAAKAAKYLTVGTVEFIMDEKDNFYFLEMNTRIQVEHTVTEVITGVDLVKLQIRLSNGEDLKLHSDSIPITGHAIECRINAENPEKDFIPSPGKIKNFIPPGSPGIRIDTHVYEGYVIPTFYDSMVAKLVVFGQTRQEAVIRLRRALGEFSIDEVKTTIPFFRKVAENESFIKGEYTTDFVIKHIYGGGE